MKIAPTVIEYRGHDEEGNKTKVIFTDEIEAFAYIIDKELESSRDIEHVNYIINYLTRHHFRAYYNSLHYIDFYKRGKSSRSINKKFKKKEIKKILEILDITC